MPDRQTHLIVGAGLAGAKAAETLREEGFDGRIVLIGAEPEQPYERPPLSKGYLRGEDPRDDALVHPSSFYADNAIELRTDSRVVTLDPAAREVELAGGERLGWDRLLLATGARPRQLRVAGSTLAGIHNLRDLADADRLRSELVPGKRLAVIGAGWIGSEVAASARQLGVEVTLVEQADLPLEPVLGPELGRFYKDVHRDNGVAFLTGAKLEAFEGPERVTAVRLTGGRVVECDAALVGIGVTPRTELAEAAGLDIDDGILTGADLQTSAAGVFAAGDVARIFHPFYGETIRVEHWANAIETGEAAARAMLGRSSETHAIPYFFSDQYEVGMEYVGYAASWDEVVFRGDPLEREFLAFWLADGRVVAGMAVGIWEQADLMKHLIRSRARVATDRLRDHDIPLELLAPASGGAVLG